MDTTHTAAPAARQDFAEVRGWGYVSGLTPDKADELVQLIPTLGTDTMTWGRGVEGEEPRIEPDGRVRVAMAYGPVLGAWPADLRKKLQAAADKVQPGAHVEVVQMARDVHATRAAYDGEVKPPEPEPVTDEPPEDEDTGWVKATPEQRKREEAERKARYKPLQDRVKRDAEERHARWRPEDNVPPMYEEPPEEPATMSGKPDEVHDRPSDEYIRAVRESHERAVGVCDPATGKFIKQPPAPPAPPGDSGTRYHMDIDVVVRETVARLEAAKVGETVPLAGGPDDLGNIRATRHEGYFTYKEDLQAVSIASKLLHGTARHGLTARSPRVDTDSREPT